MQNPDLPLPPMSPAARSVFVFALYLVPVGAGLLATPNTVLTLLGFPASSEIWPRVVGVLALALAYYYAQAARGNVTAFFRWSIHARSAVCVAFVALVLLRVAPAPLALMGLVDLFAAGWTARALRREMGAGAHAAKRA